MCTYYTSSNMLVCRRLLKSITGNEEAKWIWKITSAQNPCMNPVNVALLPLTVSSLDLRHGSSLQMVFWEFRVQMCCLQDNISSCSRITQKWCLFCCHHRHKTFFNQSKWLINKTGSFSKWWITHSIMKVSGTSFSHVDEYSDGLWVGVRKA